MSCELQMVLAECYGALPCRYIPGDLCPNPETLACPPAGDAEVPAGLLRHICPQKRMFQFSGNVIFTKLEAPPPIGKPIL